MLKAKNWIIGAAAIFILVKLFGEDAPEPSPAPVSATFSGITQTSDVPAEQAAALGFMQATSPRQADEPAVRVRMHPLVGKWLYARSRVNMRVEPTTSAKIATTVARGDQVKVLNYKSGWFSVSYNNRTGWVSERYLSEEKPPAGKPKSSPPPKVSLPAVAARISPPKRSGQPVRSAYVGACDCPYDLMRNGRLCGGRSAYSRPGGRNPVCYH